MVVRIRCVLLWMERRDEAQSDMKSLHCLLLAISTDGSEERTCMQAELAVRSQRDMHPQRTRTRVSGGVLRVFGA